MGFGRFQFQYIISGDSDSISKALKENQKINFIHLHCFFHIKMDVKKNINEKLNANKEEKDELKIEIFNLLEFNNLDIIDSYFKKIEEVKYKKHKAFFNYFITINQSNIVFYAKYS